MSRFGKFIKRQVKTAEKVGKKVAGYATQGQIGGKGEDKGSGGTVDKGPQFTDAARSQAAGAGTVGFTQRTQNY